jgi:hypothetical protein
VNWLWFKFLDFACWAFFDNDADRFFEWMLPKMLRIADNIEASGSRRVAEDLRVTIGRLRGEYR